MAQMNIRIRKSTACVLLATFLLELFSPMAAFALTSGPSQPEMQSFEPVGTTDMVNAFSGDFVYNIPLLDVEGYPINIAYHGGITAEEEASWVGLGWNINPGNINRGVRGIPDDFNGETIEKEIHINDEVRKRFGLFFGLEVAGVGLEKGAEAAAKALNIKIGGNVSMGISVSNYTGVSASFGLGSNVGLSQGWISAGVNMGATFTTDNGVDLDKSVSIGTGSKASKDLSASITGSFGKGYNSREGLKYTSFGVNPGFSSSKILQRKTDKGPQEKSISGVPAGVNNTVVPISMQNFVPVITNASYMESNFFQFKVGIETTATIYPNFGGNYGEDIIRFESDGTRRAYGYFNLENASKEDITDFTRDRDGRFSRDMQYLPSGNMTYDVYSVNGQGTAGMFRGFRNDVGTVYDPYTNSDNRTESNVLEIGAGNIFEAGWDNVNSYTSSSSGPWNKYKNKFSSKKAGSLFEPHYFKQAGELTEASADLSSEIKGTKPLRTEDVETLKASPLETGNPAIPDERLRAKRANLLYYFTAQEASYKGVSLDNKIRDFQNLNNLSSVATDRVDAVRRAHQASEYTQLLPDGRRYIYGIPAMNNTQVEYVASCTGPGNNDGTISLSAQSAEPYGAPAAGVFGQKFYMKSTTPSYAHSYLLSAILSPDYVDLTGDGATDDDLGSYTKFNYTRKNANYYWRTPYTTGSAQYDEGVLSDCHDDKGTFIAGSKELWMLHSVETRNYVAIFHTTPRLDGKGSLEKPDRNPTAAADNYKLDKIVLYNKAEWLANTNTAIPIKTVEFTYNYSLCAGTLNSTAGGQNKLTLKAISIKFGNSDAGYLSPYRFSYNGYNPPYSNGGKDMWGNYKHPTVNALIGYQNLSNHQFPYVLQDSSDANMYASSWNLTDIKLPSGGAIHVDYESDDYSFVQNRRAMEMFKVEGVGPDPVFVAGSSLYQSQTNPYLYVYFKRKKDGSHNVSEWYNDMKKTYLDNGDLIQYNFKVKMSANGETTPSCNIPLEDHIKGYAAVDAIGVCSGNTDYGYIKLAPKNVDKMPALSSLGVSNLNLNPVTLAAIFYAKYYNSKALYPSSEIVSLNNAGAILKALINSFGQISDYFRSPIAKYLNEQRAKFVSLDQSYIRLCSQGKKYGGGHRVKRIEFRDNWDAVSTTGAPVATYGSDYDYTMLDEATGRKISSGVASYEPIVGGDENPFKEPLSTDRVGQKKDFPVVIPTELTNEGPVGESMYPSASVGYSKVTVTSIHKAEGASSQGIQVHEFYTAKDFPVRTANTPLQVLEDRQIKPLDLSPDKKEAYRVGQGYSLFFNDMHGKPKKESTWLEKAGEGGRLVSYKKYEYFTNDDKTLKNDVVCMSFASNSGVQEIVRTLGVETDIMLDSREKAEKTNTNGFMANLNIFMGPAFPIPIPTAFPKLPKSIEKSFSSIASTKVTQQYGILKSVETFDKGATVKMTNLTFDPYTGQALITSVNTEHNDRELQVKYPAYWAYRCMGPAYRNIRYEEQFNDKIEIINDTCFLKTTHPERYNLGDELLLDINNSCNKGSQNAHDLFKLWVVDKHVRVPEIAEGAGVCDCPISQLGSGYSLSNVPLYCPPNPAPTAPTGAADPRYSYMLEKDASGNLLDPTISSNYSPCTTTPAPRTVTAPWITGNLNATGYTYFKTTINVSDVNKNTILMECGGDWDHQGLPNIPPINTPPSGVPSYPSFYWVNNANQSWQTANFYVAASKVHPQGLVVGQNEIVFKIYNCCGLIQWYTEFHNCPRPVEYAIAALPLKRGALSVDLNNKPFPTNDQVHDAKVMVIRSGRRNQLHESAQNLTVLNKAGDFRYSNYFGPSSGTAYPGVNFLTADAQTFTDEAGTSASVAVKTSPYNNPYSVGRKGNYRILAKYNINLPRVYSAALDVDKGIMNMVTSYWKYNTPDEYYEHMAPTTSGTNNWFAQAWVRSYSPWGNDLEVQDAAGNIQSNLYGYGNTLPIATVKNSAWNDALYENFEDNAEPATILNFYQNALHQYVKQTTIPVGFTTSSPHTGSYALNVTSTTSTTFPVSRRAPASFPSGALYPFHFIPGNKYIVSYWQKATSQNTANLTAAGALSLTIASTTFSFYPKTPVIDGWILYEGEVTVPANPFSPLVTVGSATITLASSVLDDIRILPADANMKAYVYNAINRKLVAVLDENHMASFFEYDAEGKLVRVKKETEKGILTLKESRSSLHNIINTSSGNGSINLTQ